MHLQKTGNNFYFVNTIPIVFSKTLHFFVLNIETQTEQKGSTIFS